MSLVNLPIDYVDEIILRAMDSDNLIYNTGNIELADIPFEKEREQFVSVCLACYLFISMRNRPKKVAIIADNKILML